MNELEGAQAIIDAARDYCDAKPSAMGRIVQAVNTYDEREALIESLRSTVLAANAELERRTEEMQGAIEEREALIRELVGALEYVDAHIYAHTQHSHTKVVLALAKAKEIT